VSKTFLEDTEKARDWSNLDQLAKTHAGRHLSPQQQTLTSKPEIAALRQEYHRPMYGPRPDWEGDGGGQGVLAGIEFEFNVSSCEVGLLTAPPGVPRPARHSIHGTPVLSEVSQGQHLASSNPMERAESLRRRDKERGRPEAAAVHGARGARPAPLLEVRTIASMGGEEVEAKAKPKRWCCR
jgi:hypothetical protein